MSCNNCRGAITSFEGSFIYQVHVIVRVVPPSRNLRLVPSYHISPLVGEEGAVPEGMRSDDLAVVEAVNTAFEVEVPT